MADKNFAEEEMTVELELDGGVKVTCAVITILTVNEKDYIALMPLDEDGQNDDGEVWFYRYFEDESDPKVMERKIDTAKKYGIDADNSDASLGVHTV